MNKQNTQTGSAHVILIIILIVVILGGLGFVAYRALSKPAETKKAASSTSQAHTKSEEATVDDSTDTATDSQAQADTNTIAFKDWGVVMTQPTGGDFYVTKDPTEDLYYAYSTKVNTACSNASGEREPKLYIVSRFVKDAKATEFDGSQSTKTNAEFYAQYGIFIGNYVYVNLPGGNAACSGDNDANKIQNDAKMNFSAQLKATLKQV